MNGTTNFKLFFGLLLAAPVLAGQSLDQAVALHEEGRLPEALRAYRAVAAATAKSDPALAAAALNNACVVQQDLGDYRASLPDCEEALRLRRADGDPASIAETLNNLGLTLETLGRAGEAEAGYREALAINRKLGDAGAEAINLGNLAALALQAGRYSEAMRLYTEAGTLADRHGDEPWAAEQREIARINQGVVLEKVGAWREALDLYKGLLAGSGALDPRRRAALLVNAGVMYRNLGDPVSAVEAFREAVATYRELGDTAGLSNASLNLGLALHLNLARPAEAEGAYREALRLAEESGDRTEEIQDLFYLGRLLLERGRPGEAEAAFRRCLAAASESGSSEGRWSAREGLGRIAAARGDLAGALRHLESALSEIERVREGIARSAWRSGYFGDKRAVYAATVDVLWRMEQRQRGHGFAGRALGIVQRAKARDLLDALGTGRSPAAPLTADAIKARAGDDVLLEYFLGEERLYRWTVRRSGVRMTELGAAGPIVDAVVRVHRSLSRGAEPEPAAVAGLSRTLLADVGPLPSDGGRLRIAPDGLLHYLPFEILEIRGEPLVEGAAVSYLPSASMVGRERVQKAASLRLAGFGAPQSLRASGLPEIPRIAPVPLPAARRELAAIGDLLGGKNEVFLGEQATEGAFRQAYARGARVVHFATHTVVDEGPGGGAAILLSPEGGDDGLLRPREIAGLEGRSELAVLAACRTALGSEREDGHALVSLTGSFLAAGSPAVVATLWDVGDAATAAFMEQLYAQLGRGLPPDEALRRAKLRLRADPRWNRPALWAGYVLVGEAPPVAPSRTPWILGGGAAAVLLGLAALRITRSRAARSRASA
ncbi:MAG TPA: CHAT domain-containing tetratricopeptide repeat protein [Thermoanaerobaculia bacterium]|nr:CHAT domain-containing tetratricopeptide repeat protein [Thermoanaerobaculia bacterium]